MPSNFAKVRRTVLIGYPGVTLLDITGPAQVFSSTLVAGSAPYEVIVASPQGGLVETDTGLSIATVSLAEIDENPIDTLLVAGGNGVFEAAEHEVLVPWIRTQAELARRIGSTCMGAFVIAAAGLLDGRRAVTHWRWCEILRTNYPDITVESDPIFIKDRNIWSSAGVSAGIDLALAMVEEDFGHSVALDVARNLVVFLKRPGGQSQFSTPLKVQTADRGGAFDRLHGWIAENLDADLRVDRLAEVCGMSPRTFNRNYTAKTGATPARAVEAMRVEAAKRMLEQSRSNIVRIAEFCGFGDDERLRRAFIRNLGVPPAEYRRRFGKV